MPDLEFLPDWYPQVRRRRRLFHLQAWGSLLVLAALAMWFTLVHRNVSSAAASLAAVDIQLEQSKLELVQLQEQLRLKSQLEFQRQIVSRLGLPLEMSRLVRTLDSVMPKEMSLLELNFETEEQPIRAQPSQSAAARQAPLSPPLPPLSSPLSSNATPQIDRRLSVRLVGVAPSDGDLANFLAGLTGVPFLENVAMTYSRDKSQAGHLMREFEVTFTMNLNRSMLGE